MSNEVILTTYSDDDGQTEMGAVLVDIEGLPAIVTVSRTAADAPYHAMLLSVSGELAAEAYGLNPSDACDVLMIFASHIAPQVFDTLKRGVKPKRNNPYTPYKPSKN